MKRIRTVLLTILCAMPVVAGAFGLGQLQLESGLNQPFEARIEVLSATADELSSLNIGLADTESFQRAGIDRLFILSSLKFEIHETESGPDFIRVFTADPIREPYLNFLVEAAWSKGRLLREYTVLLDPPLYDPMVRRPVVTEPGVTAPEPVSESDTAESVAAESIDSVGSEEVAAGGYTKGEYGPTGATDTLWSIASATRPDSAISIQQMMIALQRANPEAFTGNNINGLKRGQVLRMPDREEVLTLSQADAIAEASAQNAMWQESQGLPVTTPTRPVSTSTTEDTGDTTVGEAIQDSSELRLVASSEAGTGTTSGDAGVAADTGATDSSLALANEQVEALSQENLELKDRLTEAESIIQDLRRLISLKDDELASIQQQVAESGEVPTDEQEPPAGVQPAEPELTETPAVQEDTSAEQPIEESVSEPEAAPEETEITPAAETPPAEAEPAAVSEPVTEAAPAPAPAPSEAPQGMVDQILGMVMENLVIVAAVGGGLIVVIVGFVFISRRRSRGGEAVAVTEYEEAVADEGETAAPGEVDREAVTAYPETGDEEAAEAKQEGGDRTVFMAPAPEPEQPAVPEEDPLAEVNVFLAYEHFDQAEEFVRDAITGNPDNLDFHTKLLEVFYASGDKSKYEEAARVLNEKVNGSGPHWDMTVAMWSEMSPNRALFEAGGAEEEAAPAGRAAAGGGVFDLTAGEESKPAKAAATDMNLDFDLGDATDVPAVKKASPGSDEVLDLTAAVGQDEDLLDVTAAVGLEPEPVQEQPAEEEMMLDITSDSKAPADNLLDISVQGGDNLLDVTAHTDTGTLSGEEDLLDVTSATSAGADSDELLEIEDAAPASEKDEHLLDFDIGGIDVPAVDAPAGDGEEDSMKLSIGDTGLEEPVADNVIEFDAGASAKDEDQGLEISIPDVPAEEAGLEFDIGLDSDTGGELGLSMSEESIDNEEQSGEKSKTPADGDLEIDLTIGDSGDSEPSLELDTGTGEEGGIEFDLTSDAGAGDLDMESTLKIPGIDMGADEDEDDEDDHTVFVPRSADAQEQSAEDEIATKLDLAKAYVELGDKDSARGMLEEIIRDGNPRQKATAKELLQQVK